MGSHFFFFGLILLQRMSLNAYPRGVRGTAQRGPHPPVRKCLQKLLSNLRLSHERGTLSHNTPCMFGKSTSHFPGHLSRPPAHPRGTRTAPCQSQLLPPWILTTALRGGCHNPLPRQTQAATVRLNHTCVWLHGLGSAHSPRRQIKCQILGKGAETRALSREGSGGLTGFPQRLEAAQLLGAAFRVYKVPCASGALFC